MAQNSPPLPGVSILDRPSTDVYGPGFLQLASQGSVAATIIGTNALGQTLQASTDVSFGGTKTYQWLRDGVAIAGATSNTYAVVSADQGKALTCQVSGLVFVTASVSIPAAAQQAQSALIQDPRIAYVGDSLIGYGNTQVTLGSGLTFTRDPAGMVTVTGGTHGISIPQRVHMGSLGDASFEGIYDVLIDSPTQFRYQTAVVSDPKSTTGGSNPVGFGNLQSRHSKDGIHLALNTLCGGRLRHSGNYGRPGATLVPIQTSVAQAAASNADVVILEGGGNDRNGGTDAATIFSRMQTAVNTLRAAGKKVIIINQTPESSTTPNYGSSSAKRQVALDFNALLPNLVSGTDVQLVDAFSALVDTGNYPYIWANWAYDGTHWAQKASNVIAGLVKVKLDNIATYSASILPMSSSDVPTRIDANGGVWTAILQRGSWDGVAGGVVSTGATGQVASNCTVFCGSSALSSACSLVARGAGLGYWQRMVITPGAATTTRLYYYTDANLPTLASLGLAVGDQVMLAAEIQHLNGDAGLIKQVALSLKDQADALLVQSGQLGTSGVAVTQSTVAAFTDPNWSTLLMTGPITIPPGTTQLRPVLEITASAVGSTTSQLDSGKVILFKKTG